MEKKTEFKSINILLVEDNPGDVRLTIEVLKDNRIVNKLSLAGDGEEALKYLRKEKGYENVTKPDLILLDLNLPKIDGRQVLAEIKNDEKLKRIPVIVLTTSKSEEDILKMYNLHANCYITKPIDLKQFMKVIKTIEEFWLTIVKLPK
jgi:CheY-like chemotaxis protein